MKDVTNAVAFSLLIPSLMKAGREVGYAIAVHGSMSRDLDLVAIPWTEGAVSAERLILHLVAAVDGHIRNGSRKVQKEGSDEATWETVSGSEPAVKPHGRLAWTIHLGHNGMYLDVSVMPRVPGVSLGGT